MISYLKDIILGPKITFEHPQLGSFVTRVRPKSKRNEFTWSTYGNIGSQKDVYIILDGSNTSPYDDQINDMIELSSKVDLLLSEAIEMKKMKNQVKSDESYSFVLIHPEDEGYFMEFSGDLGSTLFVNTFQLKVDKVA